MEKQLETREYEIAGFASFKEVGNISDTFVNDIARGFNGQGVYSKTELLNFSQREFYNFGDEALVFKYSSLEELKEDSESWKKRFKKKNSLTSEKIDGNQVLESSGYFEYKGNFYLIGLLYFDVDEENTDESKGLYKGVIVSPSAYFEGDEIIENLSNKTENDINGIV